MDEAQMALLAQQARILAHRAAVESRRDLFKVAWRVIAPRSGQDPQGSRVPGHAQPPSAGRRENQPPYPARKAQHKLLRERAAPGDPEHVNSLGITQNVQDPSR